MTPLASMGRETRPGFLAYLRLADMLPRMII